MPWYGWCIIGAIGLILFVLYSFFWVGAGCDAHLDMKDNERRCRR